MKRLFAIALFIALTCPTLAFWQSRDSGYNVSVGATYQGPGDVVSGALAFYSCRAYSAAKAGTKAYRIVRASDSTQTDINSLSNGLCDTSTPTTFCNATTCKFVTWYDQSGALACSGGVACDVTQATGANQPAWTASSLNGWPCATNLTGITTILLQAANGLTSNQSLPLTYVALSERTGNFTTVNRVITQTGGNVPRLGYSNAANTASINAGVGVNATASDNAYHALMGVFTGSATTLVVDNTPTSGAASTTAPASGNDLQLMQDGAAGILFGSLCEAGIWTVGFNSTQYGNMNTNMHGATNGWNF